MLRVGSCWVLFEFYFGFVLVSMFDFWLDLIHAVWWVLFGFYSGFVRSLVGFYLKIMWVVFVFHWGFVLAFILGFYFGSMWFYFWV